MELDLGKCSGCAVGVCGVERGKQPTGLGADDSGLNHDSEHENEREAGTLEIYFRGRI